MKTAAVKRDLNEMKNSMMEINDIAATNQSRPSLTEFNAMNGADAINELKKKIRSSMENLVDDDSEQFVTFPDDDNDPHNLGGCLEMVNGSKRQLATTNGLSNSLNSIGKTTVDTVKFEEKRTKTESKTKVVTDGYSSEQATSNLAEMKRLQTGDIDYKEAKAAAATRNRLEMDGVKTEENAAVIQEALSLRTGGITQQASNNVAAASLKVQSDTFSADKKAITQSQASQTRTSNGIISQEKHSSSMSQSKYTMKHEGVTSMGSSMISSSQMSATNGHIMRFADLKLDDLQNLSASSELLEVEQTKNKYSGIVMEILKSIEETQGESYEKTLYFNKINEVMRRAWAVPKHGHELGMGLCDTLRESGGLDLLMTNCVQKDMRIQFSAASLLEQCLTTENRTHVVQHGLDKVVNAACVCTKNQNTDHSRVGTGILEHLFKHSEGTCSDVIKLGGLDAVLFECRTSDIQTLQHCASALANLSLYGGSENQEAMILRKVPMWLFPLAFHQDDNIKYYACLAIAVLVANKEIEAEVLKSGCLDLVEPFVTSHDPSQFAKSNTAHAHGQSKHWLQRLVPVLSSNREEARNLAAFHFCMEAGIKNEQGKTQVFHEIGAIEALKTVASCPNAIASKFAAQALRLIGETVPHKLSQQVPLWNEQDVQEWVKQIGFGQYVHEFEQSRVDGDLLLNLTTADLANDIGIKNGILLKRFERELYLLKRMADYSLKDTTKLYHFLADIDPNFSTYTYSMLNAGIDRSSLPTLNEDMLMIECNIANSIHRLRILNAVKCLENSLPSSSEENIAKTLDVFVSYRRSNGSQLASLLKVHLQLRGFSVFIDVERLEAGKFDNGLLNSIRQAKNFVLVLTPQALDRCVGDDEGKDWVHREIVAALNANCNIIPITDENFVWPDKQNLPEDMNNVSQFNAIPWSHDYQDACIDKVERFLRGEKLTDRITALTPSTPGTASISYQRMQSNESDYQVGSGVVGGSNSSGTTNGGGGQANHQANRYRQSSSPARARIIGSPCSNNNQLSVFGRGSKRNLLPPYRTQQPSEKPKPLFGSMQNMVPFAYRPPRRSSAFGINNDKKNASNSYRSHSVDGLLDNSNTGTNTDQRIAEAAKLVAAGSMALTNASSTSTLQPNDDDSCSMGSMSEFKDTINDVARREKPANLKTNPQHRKSRSLDHFLDEQTLAALVAPPAMAEGTQSMQNLALPMTPDLNRGVRIKAEEPRAPLSTATATTTIANKIPTAVKTASPNSQRNSKSFTPERAASLRNNAITRQSPEGISSCEDDHEDSKTLLRSQSRASAHVRGSQNNTKKSSASSLETTNSNNANNKTIFNRTMKKVRSLIKKP